VRIPRFRAPRTIGFRPGWHRRSKVYGCSSPLLATPTEHTGRPLFIGVTTGSRPVGATTRAIEYDSQVSTRLDLFSFATAPTRQLLDDDIRRRQHSDRLPWYCGHRTLDRSRPSGRSRKARLVSRRSVPTAPHIASAVLTIAVMYDYLCSVRAAHETTATHRAPRDRKLVASMPATCVARAAHWTQPASPRSFSHRTSSDVPSVITPPTCLS
jgi:hypothetical protein